MKVFVTIVTLSLSFIAMPCAFAGDVTGLTSFSAGTPARAADVNTNFTAVKTAVDDNNARIVALVAENTTLNARLAALEAKLASVSVVSVNNQPTIRFEGVNVQIVNGLTVTDSVNGAGNLLIGYDEMRTVGASICSLGTTTGGTPITDATACATAGGTFALNHKTGSHNLIVGSLHSYSRAAGVVFGLNNTVNGENASVSGGLGNTASGTRASIFGGIGNTASGRQASVSGGSSNTASGASASVSGGSSNTASGVGSSVSGGNNNSASQPTASISGGTSNIANGFAASVSGGTSNIASGNSASVSGGAINTASGISASVSGGGSRSAGGTNDWAAGALYELN